MPAAIHECTGLLATSLGFRGYALRNEAGELPGLVRRAAIRNLLSATLLHCTDDRQAPADLVLDSAHEKEGALVTVAVRPTPAGQGIRLRCQLPRDRLERPAGAGARGRRAARA